MNSIVDVQYLPDDELRTQVIESLIDELASHTFNFENMSPKDMVNLLLAFDKSPELQSAHLIGSLCKAIYQRLARLQPETFLLLAKESRSLPDRLANEIRAELLKAVPDLERELMRTLANQVVAGSIDKSASAVSKAVDVGREVYQALVQIDPSRYAADGEDRTLALERLMTRALGSSMLPFPTLENVYAGDTVVLKMGKKGKMEGKPVAQPNEISVAFKRPVNGKSASNDHETLNLQLTNRVFGAAKLEAKKPRVPSPTLFVPNNVPRPKLSRNAAPVMRSEFPPEGSTPQQTEAFMQADAQKLLGGLAVDVRKMLLSVAQPDVSVDAQEMARINKTLDSLKTKIQSNHPLLATIIPRWSLQKAIGTMNIDQKRELLNALPALKMSTWLLADEGTYESIKGQLERQTSSA